MQVSELSHRSGTAEGVARSLEDEVARLRAQATQLTAERHDREAAASEARSRMVVLDEKVRGLVSPPWCWMGWEGFRFGGGGSAGAAASEARMVVLDEKVRPSPAMNMHTHTHA